MKREITRIGQIGILVCDLKQAVSFYETELGIGEWEFFDSREMPEMEINGQPGQLNIIGAISKAFAPFEIELIQPVGDGIYMDYLRENGPGLHHMAVITRDHCCEESFRCLLQRAGQCADGSRVMLHSKFLGYPEREGMDVAYLDYRKEAGTILEVYNEDRV